jgi:hypothetical protein
MDERIGAEEHETEDAILKQLKAINTDLKLIAILLLIVVALLWVGLS